MRVIVIFATLTAAVLARPDVSHLGYKYKSNGASSNVAFSGGNGGAYNGAKRNGGHGYSDSASFGSTAQVVSTGAGFDGDYNTQMSNGFSGSSSSAQASSEYVPTNGNNGFSSSGSSNGFSNGNNGNNNAGVNLIEGQTQTVDLTGGSNGGQRVVYKPVIKQGEPIITKNFYVHAAPEDDEDVRVEEKVQVVRPQKTYKIIFIKAPSTGAAINNVNYPIYPQNEEKTIVYVLSKKDDQISDIGEIPTPPPPVTHKPDVFFIKYKTRKEAAEAVANIQSQFQQETHAAAGAGSGSGSEENVNAQISDSDIRFGEGAMFDQGSIGGAVDSGSQTFQASSQTQFGPTGGHIAIQSSQFTSNGNEGSTGGQIAIQSSQFTSNGSEGQEISQSAYAQAVNGQAFTSDSSSSSAEFLPQNLIKIHPDQSSFRQQAYLPPSACSNC